MAGNANSINENTTGISGFSGTAFVGSPATQYSVQVGGATSSTLASLALGTAGQVLTSNGAGSNPSFQNTKDSVWTDEAVTFAAASNTNYFVTANATATLPATPAQGDTIKFIVTTSATTLIVTANTGETIRLGAVTSSSAGTATNNAQGDSLTLVYQLASTTWFANNAVGTWTLA